MRQPKFYDNCLNTGGANVAQACAMAAARRACLNRGDAYKVVANWKGKEPFYWDGCRYDVLGLAKSLFYNNAASVVMTDPNGNEVDIAKARY